jgi:iron complex transport system permease protein
VTTDVLVRDAGALVPLRRSFRLARFAAFVAVALAAGGAIALLNLSQGVDALGAGETLRVLATGLFADDRTAFVLRELRLPRVVLGALVGAMFGLAGVVMQDALRNPLAAPDLLGISTGSSLVVAAATLFPTGIRPVWLPFLALAGGLAVGAVVLAAARLSADPVRILLVGAALTSLLGAMLVALIALAPDGPVVAAVYRYLSGSVSGTVWGDVRVLLPWFLLTVPVAAFCGRVLNLFRLGDELAAGVGGDPARTRLLLFLLAGLLVAPGVAFAGPIAFVSLLGPHVARRALGTGDARQVLPAAALAGAVVVLAADALGRLLLSPRELPAGVWTVIVGGPALLLLLRRSLLRSGR